jgi:hypothetical protein
MREHQFDDINTVIDYNSELWFRFLSACENGIKTSILPQTDVAELSQSLDLIRAINSYRAYSSPEKLFEAYPELSSQKEYVDMLWEHFNSLSEEEMSNLVIDMIHEVCNCSDLLG